MTDLVRSRTFTLSDRAFKHLAIWPTALVLVLVGLVPLIYAFAISLQDYDLVNPPARLVGIENYVSLLTDTRFVHSLQFTILFALVSAALELVIGFGIAYVLADRQVSGRFSSVTRTLLMVPYMVAPVVMAYVFKTLVYDPSFGYLNYFLGIFGLPVFEVFRGSVNPILSLVVMDVLLRTPFVVLILYAGISSVSEEVIESASIDGASTKRLILGIFVPIIRPIIVIAFVFRFMDALKIFDEIYVLTGGGPGYTTESVSIFAAAQAFSYFKMGYATASTLVFFVVVLVLTTLLVRGTRFEA